MAWTPVIAKDLGMTRSSRRNFLVEPGEELCAGERNNKECSQPTFQAMCPAEATSQPATLQANDQQDVPNKQNQNPVLQLWDLHLRYLC